MHVTVYTNTSGIHIKTTASQSACWVTIADPLQMTFLWAAVVSSAYFRNQYHPFTYMAGKTLENFIDFGIKQGAIHHGSSFIVWLNI